MKVRRDTGPLSFIFSIGIDLQTHPVPTWVREKWWGYPNSIVEQMSIVVGQNDLHTVVYDCGLQFDCLLQFFHLLLELFFQLFMADHEQIEVTYCAINLFSLVNKDIRVLMEQWTIEAFDSSVLASLKLFAFCCFRVEVGL